MNFNYWLQLLYDNVSKLFSKVTSSNTYKIISTIANELDTVATLADEVKWQINITTAVGDSLDKHGVQFGLTRLDGEGDDEFRIRLLRSFTQTQLTKPNFKRLAKDFLPEYDIVIREPIYDRWFLIEPDISKKLVVETVVSTDSITSPVSGSYLFSFNIFLLDFQ